MALISTKCPACGDEIKVDNELKNAVCPSCGSTYAMEQVVNNNVIHNQNIAKQVNIYQASPGQSKESLLDSALVNLNFNDQKRALEFLNKASDQGELDPLFANLRLLLKAVYTDKADPLNREKLQKITELYKQNVNHITKDNHDEALSEELQQELMAVMGREVAKVWCLYTANAPVLFSNAANYGSVRVELFGVVDYIESCVAFLQETKQMLEVEAENYPVRCRSFWGDCALTLLEYLATTTSPGQMLPAAEIQRLYDAAAKHLSVKGVFYKRTYSAALRPPFKGGDGAVARVITVTEDGRKTERCVSERAYCKWVPEKITAYNAHWGRAVVLAVIIWPFCKGKCGETLANILGTVWIGLLVVLVLFVVLNKSLVSYQVYREWLKSPAQGTVKPDMGYLKYCRWLKG